MIERRPVAERVAIENAYRILAGLARRWADEGRTMAEFATFMERLLEICGWSEDATNKQERQ